MTSPALELPKVLCVDDETSILNVLKRGLSDEFTVLTAPGGQAALDMLMADPEIVVLVSDQKMEGMTGIQFFQESQRIRPDAMRIMLTAYTDVDMILDAINKGHIYHFILKPFELETIKITTRRAIEHFRQKKVLEKTHRDLAAARAHILKSEKMTLMGRLMGGITHELGNPVSNILQASVLAQHEWAQLKSIFYRCFHATTLDEYVQIKQQILTDNFKQSLEDYEHVLRTIQNSTDYVKEIMQNLKSFGKFDESEWTGVHLNDAIERAVNLIYPKFKYAIRFHKNYGLLPMITGLAGPLTQVMIHLLHFAAQSFEHEGDVWVTTWCEEGRVKTAIRYNGVPVATSDLQQLFDIERDEHHTNIGLAIALNIIEKHGGTILATIAENETTDFVVDIPVVTPSAL